MSQRLFDYIALNLLSTKQLEDKLKWPIGNSTTDNKPYPLWLTFQSPYEDTRSKKLKEIHKQSLRMYAEELVKERIMEESVGNEIEFNLEKILAASFLKLDRDLLAEATPQAASGKTLDRFGLSN